MNEESETSAALFPLDVVDGVKRGDPDSVGAVYVALADRLLGYLAARVHDRATAEDLLESTFIELLQKGHTIRGDAASIKVWLFRAAHFNALDHLRKCKRRAELLQGDWTEIDLVDQARGPEERAEAVELSTHVRTAMGELSEEQRQVLLLRYVAGLSSEEAAVVMGKNGGAIRSLQHRGERALARILGPRLHPPRPAPSESLGASTPVTHDVATLRTGARNRDRWSDERAI